MGSASSKGDSFLESHIIDAIRKRFLKATNGKEVMEKNSFESMSSHFLDSKLRMAIFDAMKTIVDGKEVLTEGNFVHLAELALGGYETQAEAIYLSGQSLQSIVASAVHTFFKCEQLEVSAEVRGLLVKHILVNAPKQSSVNGISAWLATVNTFPTILRRISRKLCFDYYSTVIPALSRPTVLTESALCVISLHLPYEKRNRWNLLYATDTHGLSFTRLMKHVDGKGSCLLVIETESGLVFGGFASQGFYSGPTYRGDQSCFLFEDRTTLNVYHATGYNTRYCYMNHSKTYPSGIGMGGGFEAWSFFVDEDFNKGSSTANLSTFERCWVARDDTFTVKTIEVWGIGESHHRQRFDSDGSEIIVNDKSVLDRDPGAVAVLELSGRDLVGEAYREPEPIL